MNILREINKYDLQLYDFAMKLVNSRMHALKSISRKSLISSTEVICDNGNIEHVKPKYKYTANGMNSEHHPKISSNMMMSKLLKSYIGLFQPPGHKGPF